MNSTNSRFCDKMSSPAKFCHHIFFLLSNIKIHPFANVKYVEPSVDEHGHQNLLIEYVCCINYKTHIPTFLKHFKKVFEDSTSAKVFSINYNLKDRISLTVSNNIRPRVSVGVDMDKTDKSKKFLRPGLGFSPSKIEFIPSSLKTLDEEKKSSSGSKNRKSISCKQKQIQKLIDRVKESENNKDEIKEESPPVPAPDDSPLIELINDSSASEEELVHSDEQIKSGSSSHETLSSAIVRMTIQSDAYAKSRLNDSRIFSMVRLYLAYLWDQEKYVNFEGETKTSLGIKIQSEGLPLSKKLIELWYNFGQDRGSSIAEIRADLLTYRCYCVTTRRMRLQNIDEMNKRAYGLKGGCEFPPVPLVTKLVNDQSKRSLSILIDGKEIDFQT